MSFALECDKYNMSDFKCTIQNPIKEKEQIYKSIINFPYIFILYFKIQKHLYIYNMETQTMKINSYNENDSILSFYVSDDLQFLIIVLTNDIIIHNLLNDNKTVLKSIKLNFNDECYIKNNLLIYTTNTHTINTNNNHKKCICILDIISGEIIFKKYISSFMYVRSSNNSSILHGLDNGLNISCIFHLSLMEKNKIRMINIPGVSNKYINDLFIKDNKYIILSCSIECSNGFIVKTTYDCITRKFDSKKVFLKMDYSLNINKMLFSSNGDYFYVFYKSSPILVQLWNTKTMNILNTFNLKHNFNPYLDSALNYFVNNFSISKNNNIICKNDNIIIKYHTPFSIIEYLKINTNILPNEIWDYILVLI
jgi:hypothetical protein